LQEAIVYFLDLCVFVFAMGNKPVTDEKLPDVMPLPCDDLDHWKRIESCLRRGPAIDSVKDLQERVAEYSNSKVWTGLTAALSSDGMVNPDSTGRTCHQLFFEKTLPCIVQLALALPEARRHLPEGTLPILRQGKRAQLRLQRRVGASLLANMFLCTFDRIYSNLPGSEALNSPSFAALHSATDSPQEVAKLRMFVNFFERLALMGGVPGSIPEGEIVIDRIVGVALGESDWLASDKPLLTMEMAPMFQGFESAPEIAHADFANMYIGGGVLGGGCVQEEIRFAICPELCLSMLVCPCMREDEAIQILGGEQFSAYTGYAFSLGYGGDHADPAERAKDGTVLVSILAMDALDLRGGDASVQAQLAASNLLRDLNKSLAAFTPIDAESLKRFNMVATGNWGCGAFQGCPELKALLQWASASQCGRKIRYFPFEQTFGDELEELVKKATTRGITVGSLLSTIWSFQSSDNLSVKASEIFARVSVQLQLV
jgi:poly(ADP-ribose) glycohydrolase